MHYFKPYEAEMEKSELYMEMMGKLSDSLPKKKCLKELQEMVGENMKMICKSICADKGYCNELQNYIRENHFTNCVIVVSKSSIPYIF